MLYDNTMEQKRPLLMTSEEVAKLPILIVDKKGVLGSALAKILRDQFLVVVVTAQELEKHANLVHIPYHKKIPMIPDNAYSHIFIIYNGENELLDMLAAFEEKAVAVKARFLFITSLLYSTPKLFSILRNPSYRFLQTVLYGEIFDNDIIEANEVNFFIHQARTYGRIEVPRDGLGIVYPIFLDDVLSSIVALAFAVERPRDTIFLFPHHVYNEITVAHILQRIDPLIKVDFSKRKSSSRNYYVPPSGLYYFREYNLEERLHKINLTRNGNRGKVSQRKIHLRIPDPEVKQNRLKFLGVVLLAVFVAPLLFVLFCSLIGAVLLSSSFKDLEQGNIASSASTAMFSQNAFFVAQELSPSLLLPQIIIPRQKDEFITTLQTGETIAMTEVSLDQAIQLMKNIYEGKSVSPQTDFLTALTTIKNALLIMQKLEAENSLPQQVLGKIHNMDSAINLVEETIDTWPNLLGFEGSRTYLILFQNNMELRPGGGFIGSYGILPVDNGKIGKLQINDVYDADGQLTQQVQPPYGLQRYLGVSHWFLRDSNFDPDFTKDGAQAAEFLQMETKQKVNGVIGIDTTFLKNIISVVGPVTLPDYNVTVTPDNFYLLTETNSEKNFFAGSTQKKDFLRSLTQALLDKLASEKQTPYEKFAQMIVSSLQQKDLLFAFSDPGVQNVFTVNDLSSSLWDERTPQTGTIDDYLGIVDANVGTNKANYYLKRSITQSIVMDDLGGLVATAAATYTNSSTKTSPFGGDYKDYVRFLIPENATVTSVAFNNTPVQTAPAVTDPAIFTAQGFTPPPALEVEQTTEDDKSVVGFFFIVPSGNTRTVSITYTIPGNLDPTAVAYSYNLQLFKQPGSGDDPYQLSLSYPNDSTVVSSDNDLTNVGGKLLYSGELSTDTNLSATFSKK